MSDSEERLARIERTVEANAQAIAQLARQNQELLQTIAGTEERIAKAEERIAKAEERIASAEERLEAEVKRWDERFFQLRPRHPQLHPQWGYHCRHHRGFDVVPLLIELLGQGSRWFGLSGQGKQGAGAPDPHRHDWGIQSVGVLSYTKTAKKGNAFVWFRLAFSASFLASFAQDPEDRRLWPLNSHLCPTLPTRFSPTCRQKPSPTTTASTMRPM
jgi:hypothetical protein